MVPGELDHEPLDNGVPVVPGELDHEPLYNGVPVVPGELDHEPLDNGVPVVPPVAVSILHFKCPIYIVGCLKLKY